MVSTLLNNNNNDNDNDNDNNDNNKRMSIRKALAYSGCSRNMYYNNKDHRYDITATATATATAARRLDGCRLSWLAGWLAGWLVGWLVDR